MSDHTSIDSKFCKCGSKRPKCPYIETNRDPDIWANKEKPSPKYLAKCLNKIDEKSKIFNNALDVACTLVKIMMTVSIQECKAKKAIDSIIYAFIHFKCQTSTCSTKIRRFINKDQLYCDLRKIADMTKCEARLTCAIVSSSFKAFYYKQSVDFYDEDYVSKNKWREVACETIKAYSKYRVSSKYNIRCIAWKINNIIQWYVENKKNKCFPPDFTIACLAPCDPQATEEHVSIPFNGKCRSEGPPNIPPEDIKKQEVEEKEDIDTDGDKNKDIDENQNQNGKKDDKGKDKKEKKRKSLDKDRQDQGTQKENDDDNKDGDIDDCLEKLRQLEQLNNDLLNEIENKDKQLELVKEQLNVSQLKILEEINEEHVPPTDSGSIKQELEKKRSKGDFRIIIETKNDGEHMDLFLSNIIPKPELGHLKKLTINDNNEIYDYECKKK